LEPDGGLYTEDIDVNIMAIPNEGYHFHSWIKDIESEQELLTIKTTDHITLKPVFVANKDPLNMYRKPIKITFGPLEGFYAPSGYIADGGSPYFRRSNGYTYGWLEGYNLAGSYNPSESNLVLVTHNVFETKSSSYSWGIALPKGFYNVKLGLGAKKSQQAIKVNLGQQRADGSQLFINDSIDTDKYNEYVLENFEVKDGGSIYSDVQLTLSSVNQTEIYFIEIEPVRIGGKRRLKVINGIGSGTYNEFYGPVMITADSPGDGMVFDKWIGNTEPQYFEGINKWISNTGYIEDIYSSTTFVTKLDYITSVKATYRKK
jgi:hypothetical protein